MVYEYCVVGNGLVGAAVALELARKSSSVCVLGAAYGDQEQYYSSHEDDSRIARYWHNDPYWEALARRNAVLLQDLAARTAVPFFQPAPVLYRYSSGQLKPASVLHRNGDRNLAPQFDYRDTWGGIIEPKAYLQALNAEARKHGATFIQCIAQQIIHSEAGCTISSTAGEIRAARVVEARGIHFDPKAAPAGTCVIGKVVLYTESESNGPCSPYCFIDSSIRNDAFEDIYGIVHYKSSEHKLISKFGFSEREPLQLQGAEEIANWFHSEHQNYPCMSQAAELIRTRFSNQHSRIVNVKPCAFVRTADGRPAILADENRCVITGCNGMAAKSCQALAEQALDLWNVGSPAQKVNRVAS